MLLRYCLIKEFQAFSSIDNFGFTPFFYNWTVVYLDYFIRMKIDHRSTFDLDKDINDNLVLRIPSS